MCSPRAWSWSPSPKKGKHALMFDLSARSSRALITCGRLPSGTTTVRCRGSFLHLRTTMRQRPAAVPASGGGVVRFVASLVGLAAGNDTTQTSDGGDVGLEASTVAGRGSVDQWWPGCYAGDDRLHVLSLGIFADTAAWDLHRDGLWSKIEAIVSQASFI